MGNIITPAQIAECIEGLDPRGAASLIKSKIMPGYRLGYRFATTRDELVDFIRSHPKVILTKSGKAMLSPKPDQI